MRMNSYLTSGSATSSGSGTTARSRSGSVRYVMIRYARLTNRYGPHGNAGLVSGIAKAFARTSVSFMRLSCSDDAGRPLFLSLAAGLGEVEREHAFKEARPFKHLMMSQRAHR